MVRQSFDVAQDRAPFDRLRANGINPPCPLPEQVRDKFRKGGMIWAMAWFAAESAEDAESLTIGLGEWAIYRRGLRAMALYELSWLACQG